MTLENLIVPISEKKCRRKSLHDSTCCKSFRDETLSACQNAKAVDVLGHEILYISLAGSVTGKNPGESSISGFKLNFTPSSRVQKAVDKLKVDKVIIADSGPVIDIIINTFNQNEERNLLKGKGVKITGTKLKILGDDAGIWFASLDTEGNVNKDETTWVQVSRETVRSNKPMKIEFYVPDSLSEGNYKIVIRTRYSFGDKELKSPVTTVSKTVTVAA